MRLGARNDDHERQAERAADAVLRGESLSPLDAFGSSGAHVLRRAPGVEASGRVEGSLHLGDSPLQSVVRRASDGSAAPSDARLASIAAPRDPGDPLDSGTRARLEPAFGADLSSVRLHRGEGAARAARALGAKAFTRGEHIWLGAGRQPSDLRLMAHEAAHVVQSRQANERAVRRASEPAPSPVASPTAVSLPYVELKGLAGGVVPEEILESFAEGERTKQVEFGYGAIAKGIVELRRRGNELALAKERASLPLHHPWLESIAKELAWVGPKLVLSMSGGAVKGEVGFDGVDRARDVLAKLKSAAGALGLRGFSIPSIPGSPLRYADGRLELSMENVGITLGQVCQGSFSIGIGDERVKSFSGTVTVKVDGLADGQLDLKLDEAGRVVGATELALRLGERFGGGVQVTWDGEALRGDGSVDYTGEKLKGKVTLRFGPRETEINAEAPSPEARSRRGSRDQAGYAVSGTGELDFHFTDWLSGKAQVDVDADGHITIVGEIRPQSEVELFPQKTYEKQLFKIEARAIYGVPVLGNIFLFANVGMDATGMIGPAKLHDISVVGTYSTDPEQAQDFSITGALTISAAAGARLRGEGGAGLTILKHDLKFGAGIQAFAGVRGYADARPTIGYREPEAGPGNDKQGEFFLKGELELAAQPVLALDGDLFVELDSPWWSPAPDKKWTWPLGGKEYPLGSSLGIKAGVDYVIGSEEWPKVELQPVEFDGQKFMTDLFARNPPPPAGERGEKAASWKEGEATSSGGEAAAAGTTPPPPPSATGGKAEVGQVDPRVMEAERAHRSDPSPRDAAAPKGAPSGESDEPQKEQRLAEAVEDLAEGRKLCDQDGVGLEEAERFASAVKAKHGVFTSLEVVDEDGDLFFEYAASPKCRVP
ncbi:MAG: DUF4157 domain-containing protein, partial [Planctomycetes bacterium]|nr:DUF4157 domain-containing protein [Planctomycetota bacterium]